MGRGFAFSFVLRLAVITAIVAPSCRASVTIRGVDPALFERYIAVDGKFKCLEGTKTIPYSHVNDGYCDCIDGSDEPGTAACANGSFYCKNIGSEPVILNATFVDDGVCDCCDGSDEPRGLCKNSCRERAELEVNRLSQEVSEAESGLRIRAKYVKTAAQTKKSWSVRLQEISKLEPDAQSKVNTLKNEYTSLKQRLSKLQAKKSRLEEILKPISDNLNESSEEGPSFVEGEGLEEIDDLGNDHDALLEEEDMVDEPGPGLRTEDYEEKEESSEELAKRVASQWIPGAKQDSGDEETHVEETSEDGLNSNHALEQEDGSTLSWDGTHEAEQSDAEQEKEETEEDDDGDHGFSFYDSMKLWFWETFARIQRTSISPSGKSDPHFEKLRMAVESLQKKVDAAQAALNAADESYSKLVDEKNDLEAKQGQSYGPDDVFVVLDDHCVEAHVEKYIYKICPFHGAEQLDAGRSTSLGKWTGMSFIEPQGGGTVRVTPAMVEFRFENGETCWQGPPRSIHVSVKCGSAESLYKVAEPSRCEYTAEMTTPAACSSELVTSLRRALDSKRTLLETMPKDEL